ncbi:MAG: phage tail protein [Candidatus Binatus sp.]|uniref:phage tail protein n=1 Tax=Candidatus Binatus sp. TaxID=2811406 RepID=UPI003BAE1C39
MFAALGEIQFEVVGSPEAYESARTYDFAEQKVVESKPQLQWVGDDLERLKFELMLHASFTNPAAQLALLRATAAEHLAQPLVFGDGGFRGFFVIESINVKSQQLSAGGAPISIRVALALKEWDADSILLSSAVPAATVSPLAIATTSPEVVGANALTPGVSALLSIPAAAGARGPNLEAGDVPATVIVRSTAR